MRDKQALQLILGTLLVIVALGLSGCTKSNQAIFDEAETQALADKTPIKESKPHRSFITIQEYQIEQNGGTDPISNVRLEVFFPNRGELKLPGGNEYWPIGEGQVQPIGQTFEVPWTYVRRDGFTFLVQIERKGAWYKPCIFRVARLSEFNREYICRVDLAWQTKSGIPDEKLDKQGIKVRVFTDKHPSKME